jgi:GTP cyclohydrolase IA
MLEPGGEMEGNGKAKGNGQGIAEIAGIETFAIPGIDPKFNIPTGSKGTQQQDRLPAIIAMLLKELGLETQSEHFRDTPQRVAGFYREFTRGYRAKPAEILKTFPSRNRELIVVSDVEFFSLCPHHLLIYGGRIHVGYVPGGRIVGVSKIPRLIQELAARAVVQEDLVADIADAFMSVVRPLGCAVTAVGKHGCVAARGVRCPESSMTTVALRGIFSEDENYVQRFNRAIGQGRECMR